MTPPPKHPTAKEAAPPKKSPHHWLRDHFGVVLLSIAAMALVLRLAVSAQLANTSTVLNPLKVTDMATYRELALAIRQGNWPEVFDYQPFYYTVFLPFAYLFSPTGSPWPVIVLQALVGAATVALTGASAARLFGRKAGILAALLLALSRFHIFYTPYLLLEVWYGFWCALTLFCTIQAIGTSRRAWLWHALLGLALSGALLTRGNALLWLPGILLLVIWHGRHNWRRLALHLLLFFACFILPIAPYSVHNTRATGHFQGASVAGGKVLMLGNSPEAPPGGLEYPRTYYHWGMDEARGHMSVRDHILHWACEKPLVFLELAFRKMLLFWDATEIPNNINFDVQGKESSLLQAPFLLPWGILGSLGLAGLLLAFRRGHQQPLVLIWMMVAYWCATSAFYLLARFRIGFLPLLCCAGAGAVTTLFRQFRSSRSAHTSVLRHQRLMVSVFVAFFAIYTVNFAYPIYQNYAEPAIHRRLTPNGINLKFPHEFVLYDHSPISTMTSFVDVPSEGIELTKRFRLPDDFREALADDGVDRVVRQRLLLHIFPQQRGVPSASLTYNGTRLPIAPTVQALQGALWLAFDFEAPLPAEGDLAIFTIDLGPSPEVRQVSFGLDNLRDYGRTTLHFYGVEEETVPAEAAVEWVIPRRPRRW